MALTLGTTISVLTAATMLAVGLELEVGAIPKLAKRKLLLPGMPLGQIFLLPVLAILIVRIVPMPEQTRFVVLMLSVCPTGNVANFFTLLARGNLALSVSASACSCLLAPIVMPLTFAFYRKFFGAAFPFMVPSSVLLARIFVLTWAPIFLGVALRNVGAARITRFSALLRNACAGGTVALCVFICVTRAGQLTTDLRTNLIASATLILTALAGAKGIARVLRLSTYDAIPYVTAFPARHIGVLAVVTVATLHRFDDLDFILVYFVLELVSLLAVVVVYRWRSALQTISA